jgi:hypothetical protein
MSMLRKKKGWKMNETNEKITENYKKLFFKKKTKQNKKNPFLFFVILDFLNNFLVFLLNFNNFIKGIFAIKRTLTSF